MLFQIVLVALAIKANECALYEPSETDCVSSCVVKADGGYPSCLGNCNRHVLCSNGVLTEKLCPRARNSNENAQLTQWDQNEQDCVETSSTCPVPKGKCIDNCEGVPDGDYQSCTRCSGYVSCAAEILYNMTCSANLLWDDGLKRCEGKSNTCPPGRCMYDCDGKPDGAYQSCEGCDVFVSCSGNYLTNKQCPEGRVWNDDSKMCEYESTTCAVPSK